jgi:hypothetical protein
MGDDTVLKYPGDGDINAQFTSANINTTLGYLKNIIKNGDYKFGELTAAYYGLSQTEDQAWQDDIAQFYPEDIQSEIKRHVLQALTHKNKKGDNPIPLSIKWDPTGQPFVTCTYKPKGPTYEMLISGYPKPTAIPFATRRGKY